MSIRRRAGAVVGDVGQDQGEREEQQAQQEEAEEAVALAPATRAGQNASRIQMTAATMITRKG